MRVTWSVRSPRSRRCFQQNRQRVHRRLLAPAHLALQWARAGRLVLGSGVFAVAMAVLCVGCSDGLGENSADANEGSKASLRVLFAGSLIIPFSQLEEEFEAAHPDIDVNMEGHGSIQAVRIVGDLHEEADLVITADYGLIPMLLYETEDPDSGLPYASWNVVFATNRMALAYTPESAHAEGITVDNWYEVVNRPGVRLGCSDPRLDANGYRSLMTIKLSEKHYGQPDLFQDTFTGAFRVAVRSVDTGSGAVITVPEVLETSSGSHIILRPYSVNLLPLVKSGDLDYAFEYESVARQHGLEYITLPGEVGLGDPDQADLYSSVTVRLDFQRFASVKPEFTGEPIRYGATIPGNAREPEAAALLLAFLLGPEGQRVMADNHHPMIVPALADDMEALPSQVRPFCVPND